jgi:chloramphenicol-sensitive protein RarD
MNKGVLYGIGAYALWGLFPLYWKQLHVVDALQVIGHRISWSFVILMIYVLVTGQWKAFRVVAFERKTIAVYSIAAILLSLNWLIYVWGVNSDFIVETSLGYFINPLLSVLLGVLFLRERLRPWQWVPVGIAFIGVIYLTFVYGRPPWIALSLAFTFGFYGFVKKLSPLGSLYGLTLETGIVFPVALACGFSRGRRISVRKRAYRFFLDRFWYCDHDSVVVVCVGRETNPFEHCWNNAIHRADVTVFDRCPSV